MNRPFPVGQRFFKAVRTFHEFFTNNPNTGLDFVIANIDLAQSFPISSEGRLDPRELEKTKVIWDNLMSWNEKALQGYVDGFGGMVNKKYGFVALKDGERAPMIKAKVTIKADSIDKLAKQYKGPEPDAPAPPSDEAKDQRDEPKETPAVPKRRGRPAKAVVQ